MAEAKGVAPAQVALAWVYAQQERLGVPVAPIPGTKRVKWLEQNVAALDVTLSDSELAVLDPLGKQVAGAATSGAGTGPPGTRAAGLRVAGQGRRAGPPGSGARRLAHPEDQHGQVVEQHPGAEVQHQAAHAGDDVRGRLACQGGQAV